MVDMIEKVGYEPESLHYVFFNTGMEFGATKSHLEYLERRYRISIDRCKAKVPVPLGVKRYGCPFLSKQVSQFIGRLQLHNFKWEDKPFDELYSEYPNCKAALRWWCNEWGDGSMVNISRNKYLKEFMVANPPDFKISDKCCQGAKKDTGKQVARRYQTDLNCQGVRKYEGGARSTSYRTCMDINIDGSDTYRPVFWFKKQDKQVYEECFDVQHSECYTKYGLDRTGCACCPFGKNFENELLAAQAYEPRLYKAAVNLFGESYEYTRKYREFCKNHSEKK